MAEDIVPGLLEKVQSDYRELRENDEDLARISERTAAGSADGKDLDAYAVREGELLAEALRRNVSGDILPNGKMYFNIANRVLPPVIKENYGNVADMSQRIITGMNERAGIHIKAQRPELNEDRVKGLVNLAAAADQYEDRRKELEGDVVNFSQSVGTDTVRKNADFQYQAGLSPKIHRTAEGGCCKWCSGLSGTYDYGSVKGTGNEVWQRHRDCRCVVEFDPGNGRRQNAHSKAWKSDEDRAKRIEYSQEKNEEREQERQQERQRRIDSGKRFTIPRELRRARFANPILNSEEDWLNSVGGLGTIDDIDRNDYRAVQNNWNNFNRKENIGKVVAVSTMNYVYAVEVLSLEEYNILWKIPNDDRLNDAVANRKRRRR